MQKEPWLAVTLSFALPGAGQMYAGKVLRGCFVLFAVLSALVIGFWSLLAVRGDVRLGLAGLSVVPVFSLLNLFDAHRCCRKVNDTAFEIARKQSKDPWLAIWLTLVFMGLGHFYARKWLQGLLILASYFLAFAILETIAVRLGASSHSPTVGLLEALLSLVWYSIAMCWAYDSVSPRRETRPVSVLLVSASISIYFATLLFCIHSARRHYVEPFVISGRSMTPCLEIGDRIFVDKSLSAPLARGDLVVYYNHEKDSIWVKRAVAFQGERVAIGEEDGKVYVNGMKLDKPPFDQLTFTHSGKYGVHGQEHPVGQNSIYMLGDNSERSADSRTGGDVPMSDVRGVAYKIWYPLSRAGAIRPLAIPRASQQKASEGIKPASVINGPDPWHPPSHAQPSGTMSPLRRDTSAAEVNILVCSKCGVPANLDFGCPAQIARR